MISDFAYPDHLGVRSILSGSKINARNVKAYNKMSYGLICDQDSDRTSVNYVR